MHLRPALESDIPKITEIFNSVIMDSNSVYREEPVLESERLQWLRDKHDHGYPILVMEDSGEVIGYGGYGSFRPAQGYRLTVEHTIHIAQNHRRRGIGKLILTELISMARESGYHLMIGAIDSGNEASIKFHHDFGFTECARIREVAIKNGVFLDLVLMEKVL